MQERSPMRPELFWVLGKRCRAQSKLSWKKSEMLSRSDMLRTSSEHREVPMICRPRIQHVARREIRGDAHPLNGGFAGSILPAALLIRGSWK